MSFKFFWVLRNKFMIRVNWAKIKPYEEKKFAVPVMAVLALLFIVGIVLLFFSEYSLLPLKILTAVFLFLSVALDVKIESRMLQIYLLMGVIDVGLIFAALMPMLSGLTILFFVLSAVLLLLSALFSVSAHFFMRQKTAYDYPEPDRGAFFGGKNVMFFAPHEDDEINVFGGVIEEYINAGAEVRFVFSTNGDYYGIGKLRIKEALGVAKYYGVPRKNVIFLGYSDSLKNERGLHIYNCGDDELIKSRYNIKKTYGTKNKKPYSDSAFKRKNIVNDIKNVIAEYKPDTLFCCDYDSHADHRALSLFFEEALGEVLKQDEFYNPTVFKGFAYSTAWNGKRDYYTVNAKSTELKEPSDIMTETNFYLWRDRVRFPVAKQSLSRVMQNSSSYVAMMGYSSQTAVDHANEIINGDKTFWQRRTDSVLYNAEIFATSGNAEHLTEFKLAHSENILDLDRLPCDNAWVAEPSDEHHALMFKLKYPKEISSVVLYDNPSDEAHIKNAVVSLGGRTFNTGELKPNGSATIFEFPPIKTDTITVKIASYGGACSLNKIEAFEKVQSDDAEFIKICNENGDFIYDYLINTAGKETFSVYTYPENTGAKFGFSCDNDGVELNVDGNEIKISCPTDEECTLKVFLADNPMVYDEIKVRNAEDRQVNIIKMKQKYEMKILSPELQWEYYRGLVRRLGVYHPLKGKKEKF